MSGGPTAFVLSIGSELLMGETVDTNAAFLGGELRGLGILLREVRQLPDDRDVVARAFLHAAQEAEVVLATGGLGPTHDDLTREALADALGEDLVLDPELERQLRRRFAASGPMPESNLKQAMRVPSAQILANPIGSAPGWWVERPTGVVVLMPGVPSEMRLMWAEQVAPRLRQRHAAPPLAVRTVKTFGIGESAVAEAVGDLLVAPGDGVEAGIYARDDGVHLRFSTRGDATRLGEPARRAREALSEFVWGTDGDDLASVALSALSSAGAATVASWEADTGGALLAVLAGVPAGRDGVARYLGGVLDVDGAPPAPVADAVIQLSLLPEDANGRSPLRVAVSGLVTLPMEELRIHGSGPQRLRRAAFAALNHIRVRLRQ
ncbi:MAG TPA: molybdopterin-binding protein [candidate division Zixibacteria bacterium]|nr:molybdopterin-binding protein [candidate division Zixibacteria bacterium]